MKRWVLVFRAIDRDKFLDIVEERKTVETRAAGGKYDSIAEGDTLEFRCGTERVERVVASAHHFDSIADLLAAVPRGNVMPWAKSDADVVKTYHSFPGYEQKIARHGLVAFELDSHDS